jgi:hypothetical protein
MFIHYIFRLTVSSIETKGSHGYDALHYSFQNGHVDIVKYLSMIVLFTLVLHSHMDRMRYHRPVMGILCL